METGTDQERLGGLQRPQEGKAAHRGTREGHRGSQYAHRQEGARHRVPKKNLKKLGLL